MSIYFNKYIIYDIYSIDKFNLNNLVITLKILNEKYIFGRYYGNIFIIDKIEGGLKNIIVKIKKMADNPYL